MPADQNLSDLPNNLSAATASEDLIAQFAHDFRSPLASIRTAIEVLKLTSHSSPQSEKLILLLERQTLDLVKLVENLQENNQAATSRSSLEVLPPRTARRVLTVDDSRSAADILSLFFKMEGLEVRTAYLGEDAIAIAQESQPDIIFLDIGLPDLSGYEVAQKIRQLPGGDRFYIVALTGLDAEKDRAKIADAGFDLHLVKPPEPKMLREVLARAVVPA